MQGGGVGKSAAMRRNGNGKSGGDGGQESVPRWVRVLFDDHERLLAQMKAEMAQTKTEHEERMDEMERVRKEDRAAHEARMSEMGKEQVQTRIQAGRLVQLVDHVRKGQEKLTQVVREIHGRVSRLETRRS